MPDQLVPFVIVVVVLTITPGPDMALVLRNGVRGGTRPAWWTGLGCCAGIATHATAAVIGLSAVLAASARAYEIVKLVGAAYLVYLGATTLWRSRHGHGDLPAAAEDAPLVTRAVAFRQGVLSNLFNPKIALLFLTLLPQFVSAHEPRLTTSAELAATFLCIAVVWWRMFSLGVGALGRVLSRERVRLWFDRATGVVLVALGVRVALERS